MSTCRLPVAGYLEAWAKTDFHTEIEGKTLPVKVRTTSIKSAPMLARAIEDGEASEQNFQNPFTSPKLAPAYSYETTVASCRCRAAGREHDQDRRLMAWSLAACSAPHGVVSAGASPVGPLLKVNRANRSARATQ